MYSGLGRWDEELIKLWLNQLMDEHYHKWNDVQQLLAEIGRCSSLAASLWFDTKRFVSMLRLVWG